MKIRHWLLATAGLGLILGALYLAKVSPLEAARTLFQGTLGSASAFSGTLRETSPLLIAGIAVFIALRAGLFNIGAEGQLVVGALTSAALGLRFPGPVGLILGMIGAAIVGALWALPAGLIKAYRGGHEVITTIMLNSVAVFVTNAIVAGPLRDTSQESPTTRMLSDQTRLPWLFKSPALEISSGVLLGLVLLIAFASWLKSYVSGYELRAVGANRRAATLAGIATKKTIVWSMTASGAVAGLAGGVQVMGYTGRFYSDFSPGFGFNALGVALLAGGSALAILPAAFFFGMLAKGSAALQILGVPKGTSFMVLGVLITVFAAVRYRKASMESAS